MVWVDGRISESGTATLNALDHGVTVGDGLFETCKVVRGTPFAMRRHLLRLHRSADALGLRLPLDDDALRTAAADTVAAAEQAGTTVGRLRITVTGGPGPLGSGRDEVPATVIVAAGPADPWPASTPVLTVPWVRNERSAIAGVKSTSYAENVVALEAAHAAGASEAIFANTVGALCEGTGSNVFVVRDGRLLTPALATGCLAGITRELLLEVLDCDESTTLGLEDLRGAQEAFLSSSTRDVQPISMVDGQPLTLCPGPLTTAAIDAFEAIEARTLDP